MNTTTESVIGTLKVGDIIANPNQPRKIFDKQALKELAESIKKNGVIQPIIVREISSGKFEIVAGERRWRASKLAKQETIPVIIKSYINEEKPQVERLAENLHRADLSLEELGQYLKPIMEGQEIRAMSKKLGIGENLIKSALTFVKLDDNFKKAIGSVSSSDAMDIARAIKHKPTALKFVKLAAKHNWDRKAIRSSIYLIDKAPAAVKNALLEEKINPIQFIGLTKIKSADARAAALKKISQSNKVSEVTADLMKNSKPELLDKLKSKFDNSQRQIFLHLHEAEVFLNKASAKMDKANGFLLELTSQPVEYALGDKDVEITTKRLQTITSKLKEFDIHALEFNNISGKLVDKFKNRRTLLKKSVEK